MSTSKRVNPQLVPAIIMMWFETENKEGLTLPTIRRLCERQLHSLEFPATNVKDWERKANLWSIDKTTAEMAVLSAQYCIEVVQ